MGITIIGGSSGILADVDAAPKAARVILYGPDGQPVTPPDRSAIVPGSRAGALGMGVDYKTARLLRSSPQGSLTTTSDDSVLLYDGCEGAAVDTTKWIQTTTTMTITQAAATGVLLNAGSSVAATVGAMQTSHRQFPVLYRCALAGRFKARPTAHSANNLHELGFGNPASATAVPIGNGACWRKDGTGQWLPVVSINGAEVLGTPISDAVFTAAVPNTNYAIFEVGIFDDHVHFCIYTQGGVVVAGTDVDVDISGVGTAHFAVTHLQGFYRTYNSAGTGAAVQLFVKQVTYVAPDGMGQRPWDVNMSGTQGYGPLVSPTTYAQNANSTNNTAPTARTLSNTVAGETTLGGLISATAMAAGANDLIMFGWQNPGPHTFWFRGIKIPAPLNQVAAVSTGETLFYYGLGFNSSGVSLATAAPYPPMRIALSGFHNALVALAANKQFTLGGEIVWQPQTPIPVFPGRFFHVFVKCVVGTATATETYLWNIPVDGYFE